MEINILENDLIRNEKFMLALISLKNTSGQLDPRGIFKSKKFVAPSVVSWGAKVSKYLTTGLECGNRAEAVAYTNFFYLNFPIESSKCRLVLSMHTERRIY